MQFFEEKKKHIINELSGRNLRAAAKDDLNKETLSIKFTFHVKYEGMRIKMIVQHTQTNAHNNI